MRLTDVQNYLIYDCPKCYRNFWKTPHNIICGAITAHLSINNNWKKLLMEYLTHGYLIGPHISKNQQEKMAQQSKEYFIEKMILKKYYQMGN